MLNTEIGDCVIAAAGHMIEGWTANGGGIFIPSDQSIEAAYSAITGYDPNDPYTDNGTMPIDCLKYWRDTGIAGHQVGAWALANARRPEQIRQSVYLFGSAFIALELPLAAQGLDHWDIPDGQPLTGDWEPGSWGGHMVEAPKYDADGVHVVTWGQLMPVSWKFLAAYADEPYAILSPDILGVDGKCPVGFDLETLRKDLAYVRSVPNPQ